MTLHKDLIREIQKSPEGPGVGAFFDFDGTLISGFSATVFLKEQLRRGDVSPYEFLEMLSAVTQFSMGGLGFSGLMTTAAQFMRGVREEDYMEFGQELFEQQIARKVYPESRALVRAHQDRGHTVAIISSATPYQVEPMAQDLDIEHAVCSRYEVKDGEFTGGIIRPLCFGQGKVLAAEELAVENGIDLDQSFFYTDSDDDIELLERVGRPRPLNPNTKLTEISEREGWPIRRFRSRGQPGVFDFVRSIAATVSLVPTAVAGIPIYALTGSMREARNFATSLFADVSSALIGLRLEVRGEENLWSDRPCVFVFNHQSKADVVIIARLLRRDFAGIGKKEIKKMPVIGKTLELAGTVFIDRADSGNAIEAMRPLVDALRKQRKSVVIAPEGTRTISPKLAPFKKGAFHLAMQAGVPIVPVVIHNAGDVAPKGDFVFRPATVEVDVLPPVDTSGWRAETIDRHVAQVRAMFQRVLRQEEQLDREVSPIRSRAPSAPVVPLRRKAPVITAPKKTTPKKTTPKKKTPIKTTARKQPTAKKVARKKTVSRKAAPKKAAPKKVVRKKPRPEKAALEKAAPETVPMQKAAPAKAVSKKKVQKKTARKKAPRKKAIRKKSVQKKVPVKKTVSKKAVPKKAAPKKAAPKKAAPKKATSSKATVKKAPLKKKARIQKEATKAPPVKKASTKKTARKRPQRKKKDIRKKVTSGKPASETASAGRRG